MEVAIRTVSMGFNPEIMGKHIEYYDKKGLASHDMKFYLYTTKIAQRNFSGRFDVKGIKSSSLNLFPFNNCSTSRNHYFAAYAISRDLENAGITTASKDFGNFTVVTTPCEDGESKIRVDVSGTRTQAIFDDVFTKLVDAAQPIPGFRRVKGGKTPDIPKDILLHIIGHSKVNYQTIKKIINSTVAEYVEKEGMKVTRDLRVEQSFEELEAIFIPGKEFSFDAIIKLQGTGISKS